MDCEAINPKDTEPARRRWHFASTARQREMANLVCGWACVHYLVSDVRPQWRLPRRHQAPRHRRLADRSERTRRLGHGITRLDGRALVVRFMKTYTLAARDFSARRGASDEHIPPWICKERATKSSRKRTAARRVAPNLACGCVARRLQTHCGVCVLLAPCHRPNWAQQVYRFS